MTKYILNIRRCILRLLGACFRPTKSRPSPYLLLTYSLPPPNLLHSYGYGVGREGIHGKPVLAKTLILLLSFFLCIDSFAGSFRSLGIKDGLSSRQVFQVNKDSAGFIWAYTHMGIDRYDGNEIKHYKLDETVDSKDYIQSSTVMACDKHGNLWVALKNGNIYAYSKQTDSFQLRISLSEYLAFAALYSVLFDADNHLWLCTSIGIYSWDEAEGLSLAGLKDQRTHCIIQAEDGLYFAEIGRAHV